MLSALLVLVIIGFVLWLLLNYVPMPEPFKKVIIVIVVILLVIWLLQAFGIANIGPKLRL